MSAPDILLLVTRMNVGGPANQVLLLAQRVRRVRPTLLAAGRPPVQEGELTDPEVRVVPIPLVRPVRPTTDLRALRAVRQLVARSGARLVHTHMAKAGAIGRVAALTMPRRSRPRLVHTFHGHVLEGYFGPHAQRAFLDMERALARRTDVIIAVSPEVRDELLDLRVGKPSQYRVVPIGLDLDRLAQAGSPEVPPGQLRGALGLPSDVPLAGVVGRLVPIKDHAALLQAVASTPRVHVAVLGDGELRASLEARAVALGIADRVHFTGWWPDMATALADLDLVVLSSRNEGTPLALIEALAAARPVVATDVGGVRHVVQDGETGWLCPPDDPGALALLVQRALGAPEVAARMALEGQRRVIARFGADRMLADHLAVYEELLGPPRQSVA